MSARTLMVQGAMSSVGKSLLVTILCRIFARHGIKVAPFKAQNMSNNAAVCSDGGEIGRSQFTQALAAGIEPTVQMNPVLLKPEADARSQVIVNGRVWETLSARNYYEHKAMLWAQVTAALDSLRNQVDLVIIEGAGSPAELNLRHGDIVNMAVAKYAKSSVLLAGDIDRGGIFAQLLGTLALLEDDEKALVKGFIVNKFRGDPSLFEDGVTILEERGGVPVLGVIPYVANHHLPEEDAVAIEAQNRQIIPPDDIDIVVIALPRIANFDDFVPLAAESGVRLRYVSSMGELGQPDAIIIPGTKSTMADLQWLHEVGLAQSIMTVGAEGGAVVGICGGYQMLGIRICDPAGVESDLSEIAGLNLLSIETSFLTTKTTEQVQATVSSGVGWLETIYGQIITGYEIHMGQTRSDSPWLCLGHQNGEPVLDGCMNIDGRIWGCYLHGLFANEALRRVWLRSLGWQDRGVAISTLDVEFNRLATIVESHLDMKQLEEIIGL